MRKIKSLVVLDIDRCRYLITCNFNRLEYLSMTEISRISNINYLNYFLLQVLIRNVETKFDGHRVLGKVNRIDNF